MIALIISFLLVAVSIIFIIFTKEMEGKFVGILLVFLSGICFCIFMEYYVVPKDTQIGSFKVTGIKYNEKDNNFRYYISGRTPIGYIQSDSLIYHKNDSLKVIFEKYTEKE